MSYYSSKHPGLYIYMALVIISVMSFLFVDVSSVHIGFLAILWGTYTALRTLTLYEMSEHYTDYAYDNAISKNHNGQASALAYDLMHRMNASRNMKRGMLALYCLNNRTILWFTLALLYTAYQLHISTAFLSKNDLMETMCIFFMIGATFWAGQSYAYSKKIARSLMILFASLLCLSLFVLQSNLSYETLYSALSETTFLELGNPQTILVILALYSTAILLFAFSQNNKSTGNIIIGICLITLLAACHIVIEPSREDPALWMSGWGLFSIFWIRAYGTMENRYVLYQCE